MSNPTSNEIWLLIDSRQFGGIETYVVQLAQGLIAHQQPVKVLLITEYVPRSPLCEKLENLSIPYQYLGGSTFDALTKLNKKIRQSPPLALHANGYKASLIAKLTKLYTGVKLVSTYHAGETPKGKMWLYDWLDRWSAWIANHSIVVSKAIGAKLPSNSHYIENFIDTNRLDIAYGEQIAFVGRLSPEKAPERFITLATQFPNRNFHFYGTGELSQQLQANAPKNIQFHGHQSNMDTVWSNVSVLIICSRYEGLPMVALEAMARGIVVIATSVGELPQLIRHRQNGYLARNASDLAPLLTDWVSSPIVEQQITRQHAISTIQQNYSQQAIIPKMLKLYFN